MIKEGEKAKAELRNDYEDSPMTMEERTNQIKPLFNLV